MSNFAELETRVIAWAKDRGIFAKSDPKTQALKMASEAGELCDGVAKGRMGLVEDGIGDVLVTLILLAEMYDLTVSSCLEVALNVIEGRKGDMVNGVFVKQNEEKISALTSHGREYAEHKAKSFGLVKPTALETLDKK